MVNYTGDCNGIYGITHDPQNREYAIVVEFQNNGSIRELVKKTHGVLNWRSIINVLYNICGGLDDVHRNNHHHRDFHSGNILNTIFDKEINAVISDFGLCRPADKSSDNTLYGVLPFVAPEVLRGGEFTKAADIYGFGMVMSEIISGEAPFVDRDYDLHLALDICKGKRPLIPEYTPESYAALMKRCWDPIPTNRPTTNDLRVQIRDWDNIICKFKLNDRQLAMKLEVEKEFSQEREDRWKARLTELATNPHPPKKSQNMFTSKQLDYSKQLSQLLEAKDVEMNTEEYSTLQIL
jgi:serine/threonine protein kinase